MNKIISGILLHYSTYPQDFSFEAWHETEDLLEELSGEFTSLKEGEIIVAPEGMKGLIFIDLRGNPLSNEKKFREMFTKRLQKGKDENFWTYITKPFCFNFVVKSTVKKIALSVEKLKDRVNGKWRIKLNTRKRLPRRETIEKAAEPIKYPVDLEAPEYIVRIESLGKITGIGIEDHSSSSNT